MKTGTTIGVLAAVALVVGAAQWMGKSREAGGGGARPTTSKQALAAGVATAIDAVPQKERDQAWKTAVAKGKTEAATWPQTPQTLIAEFWLAASRKDYDRMVLLCPGSVVNDFKKYYEKWTPSPATAIGNPERHPRKPAVVVYPTTVPFPGFPHKTIKMAVKKLDDGRLVIDGANTIWW